MITDTNLNDDIFHLERELEVARLETDIVIAQIRNDLRPQVAQGMLDILGAIGAL